MRNPWQANGLWLACFAVYMALMISVARPTQAEEPDNITDNRTIYSSFATGQKYYLEHDSFQPVGKGKLQYNVTSDTSDGGRRISQNEIDCTTGQFQSPIESWQEDSQGQISDQKPGPVVTMSLSQRTELYRTLKDACLKNLPQVQMNW